MRACWAVRPATSFSRHELAILPTSGPAGPGYDVLMLSSDATRVVAARPAPGAGDRELKFTLPAGRVHIARRRLESVCRRDPEFPAAAVWTIYYDTPALISLG